MRGKEDSHDYRYFPDPDLPPLIVSEERIKEIKKSLPELPDAKKKRFMESFNLKNYDAEILVNDQYIADFFENLVNGRDPKLVVSWLTVELFSYLNKNDINLIDSGITTQKIGDLLDLISSGNLSNRQAKEIFDEYLKTNKTAKEFVDEKGVVQVSDSGEIDKLINTVLQENSKMVDQYKQGKDKLFGFFVGQVMKISKGKANPQLVNKVLKEKLLK